MKFRFSLDDKTSTDDMQVTICRGYEANGQVRMSWSDWSFPENLNYGGSLSKVVDILADLG